MECHQHVVGTPHASHAGLPQIAGLVENSERDPNSVVNIRRGMSRVSKDIILMEEVGDRVGLPLA